MDTWIQNRTKKRLTLDAKNPNVGTKVRKRRLPKYRDPDKEIVSYFRYLNRMHVKPLRDAIKEVFTPELIAKLWLELSPNAKEDGSRVDANTDTLTIAIGEVKKKVRRGKPPRKSDIETLKSIEQRTRDFAFAEHERVTALDPALNPRSVKAASSRFRKENIRLITSIAETDFRRLDNVLRNSIRQGARVETIAKIIEERFIQGVDSKGRPVNAVARARLIARDQVLKHNGQLTKLLQKESGITKYIWRTSNDERVRDTHAAADGQVFSWENPPPWGHPGEDFQCRCHAEPVITGDD